MSEQRDQTASIIRKRKRYLSDITNKKWERIAPLIPSFRCRDRPQESEFRETINFTRSGFGSRMLPIHLGHWHANSCFRPPITLS